MCLLTSCKNSPKHLVLIFHYLVLWAKASVKEEMVSLSYLIKLSRNNFSMCLDFWQEALGPHTPLILCCGPNEVLVKEKMASPSSHEKQYGGKHSILQIPLPDDSFEKFILPNVCVHICQPQSLTDENRSAAALSHCATHVIDVWGLLMNPPSIFQKCVLWWVIFLPRDVGPIHVHPLSKLIISVWITYSFELW